MADDGHPLLRHVVQECDKLVIGSVRDEQITDRQIPGSSAGVMKEFSGLPGSHQWAGQHDIETDAPRVEIFYHTLHLLPAFFCQLPLSVNTVVIRGIICNTMPDDVYFLNSKHQCSTVQVL